AEYEIDSEELFLKGAKGEDIADFDDIDKKIILLKQELRHIEEPAKLDLKIQKQFFESCTKPIVRMLINKVGKFDDLYQTNSVYMSGHGSPAGVTTHKAWSTTAQNSQKEVALGQLEDLLTSGFLFTSLQIIFRWEAFRKAGLNTFSDSFTVNF